MMAHPYNEMRQSVCHSGIHHRLADSKSTSNRYQNIPRYIFGILAGRQVAQTKCLSHFESGLDGSRTRVRNTIPYPSTSVVYYLTFPLPHDNKQPCGFSSFMIRPMAQSFANVVSHIVEAWVLKCECSRSDCCH